MAKWAYMDKRLDGIHDATGCHFIAHLRTRHSRGESMATIGRSLGVSKQAVQQWLTGATSPSGAVLLLAELLRGRPVDLADGLPVGQGDAGG